MCGGRFYSPRTGTGFHGEVVQDTQCDDPTFGRRYYGDAVMGGDDEGGTRGNGSGTAAAARLEVGGPDNFVFRANQL